jgi:hypothetical protein
MSWADIAYLNSYYDTMHLIKKFKQFANACPAALFHENPDFIYVGFETLERTSFLKNALIAGRLFKPSNHLLSELH